MKNNRDFGDVIRRKLETYPGLSEIVDNDQFQIKVSQAVYAARTAARLTQGELAKRAGTHQSVIARLEDADYDGHSLTMLRRIGEALGKELHVEFREVPKEGDEHVVSRASIGIQWARATDWHPVIQELPDSSKIRSLLPK